MTETDRHCAFCGYNYTGASKCPECGSFATRPLSQFHNDHEIGIKTDYKGDPKDGSDLTP